MLWKVFDQQSPANTNWHRQPRHTNDIRFRQIKPDLKQIHPQHFLDAHRRTAAFSRGIIQLDYTDSFILRNNFIHDFKKFFPSCLLFAAAVLNIGKCLLLHFVSPPIFDGFIIPYSIPSFIALIKSEVP